ncbi:YihY family inner membrane protein [Chitinimonas sp.]|uniref:YihY family inner membrane protein n=1 Tax=Chitinimonas sp. TaxID=1934313 RepID=UPI0035B47575
MPSLSDYRHHLISRLPAPLDFCMFILRRLRDDRCLEAAGSLTFTTLVALIPFLTITLMVVSAFPMFQEFSGHFKAFLLSNLVPDAAGKVISVYMRQFTDNADRLTAVGMLSLGVTALAMMATIDRTFNRIWRVKRQRNWLTKTMTYWAVLTLGPVLMGISLSLTGWIADRGPMLATLVNSGSAILALAGLHLLYRAVPNCPVPPRHALAAAAAATFALWLMKNLFGWYVKKFASFKLIYGAFASFPIFLLWLYLVWTIVLGGAVISASLSYWHGQAWRKRQHPGQRVQDAVRILFRLEAARCEGSTPSLDRLRRALALGQDELHELLQLMQEKGWVQSTRDEGWVLSTALERIMLREMYQLLVTHPLASHHPGDPVQTALAQRFAGIDASLEISLAELAQPHAAPVPAQ